MTTDAADPMHPQIRALTPADADAYREVRMRALREHPEAFATSEAEELQRPRAEVVARLTAGPSQVALGAFDGEHMVGLAAVIRSARPKQRHRAGIVAMYVVPEARGRGIGRALLDRAVDIARGWGATDVALAVTVGNHGARTLYERAGFRTYGVEPRALLVDGRFHDVELMNLALPAPPEPAR